MPEKPTIFDDVFEDDEAFAEDVDDVEDVAEARSDAAFLNPPNKPKIEAPAVTVSNLDLSKPVDLDDEEATKIKPVTPDQSPVVEY